MKRKMLFLGIIILTINILSGIGFYFLLGHNSEAEQFDPIIILETENPIVNEKISLHVDQIPSDSNISWFIDENTVIYGVNISIIYSVSDDYQILCFVLHNENEIKRNITISVKNADYYVTYSGPMLIANLRNSASSGEGADIFPGISQPSVKIKISVKDIIGKLGIRIMFFDYEGPGDQLYTESNYYLNENFDYENVFSYPTLPEIITDSHILGYIELDNGKTGAFKIEIWVSY